ncbi:hypothetical protein ZIOFF_074488 (mitochondrion) [Zingiber officinale]|uniref:Uncharacterized protein n=1 Tax=Zingiber officinale TaxID=94328 RepID=A0A8J5BWR4_ZINOF|nr:hypothetical protein ZIOFF_074488 [Zingiber officinale]
MFDPLTILNKENTEEDRRVMEDIGESLEEKRYSYAIKILAGVKDPEIAYCDGRNAFLPPPSPVQLPEEPVTPPEAPPVPQPVVIPQLAQPLISDDTRRSLLYNRYLVLNFGGNGDLRRMVSIIDAQVIVERDVEAALVDDGFHPNSILDRYRKIRGVLHSPQGELLSERTYHSSQKPEQPREELIGIDRSQKSLIRPKSNKECTYRIPRPKPEAHQAWDGTNVKSGVDRSVSLFRTDLLQVLAGQVRLSFFLLDPSHSSLSGKGYALAVPPLAIPWARAQGVEVLEPVAVGEPVEVDLGEPASVEVDLGEPVEVDLGEPVSVEVDLGEPVLVEVLEPVEVSVEVLEPVEVSVVDHFEVEVVDPVEVSVVDHFEVEVLEPFEVEVVPTFEVEVEDSLVEVLEPVSVEVVNPNVYEVGESLVEFQLLSLPCDYPCALHSFRCVSCLSTLSLFLCSVRIELSYRNSIALGSPMAGLNLYCLEVDSVGASTVAAGAVGAGRVVPVVPVEDSGGAVGAGIVVPVVPVEDSDPVDKGESSGDAKVLPKGAKSAATEKVDSGRASKVDKYVQVDKFVPAVAKEAATATAKGDQVDTNASGAGKRVASADVNLVGLALAVGDAFAVHGATVDAAAGPVDRGSPIVAKLNATENSKLREVLLRLSLREVALPVASREATADALQYNATKEYCFLDFSFKNANMELSHSLTVVSTTAATAADEADEATTTTTVASLEAALAVPSLEAATGALLEAVTLDAGAVPVATVPAFAVPVAKVNAPTVAFAVPRAAATAVTDVGATLLSGLLTLLVFNRPSLSAFGSDLPYLFDERGIALVGDPDVKCSSSSAIDSSGYLSSGATYFFEEAPAQVALGAKVATNASVVSVGAALVADDATYVLLLFDAPTGALEAARYPTRAAAQVKDRGLLVKERIRAPPLLLLLLFLVKKSITLPIEVTVARAATALAVTLPTVPTAPVPTVALAVPSGAADLEALEDTLVAAATLVTRVGAAGVALGAALAVTGTRVALAVPVESHVAGVDPSKSFAWIETFASPSSSIPSYASLSSEAIAAIDSSPAQKLINRHFRLECQYSRLVPNQLGLQIEMNGITCQYGLLCVWLDPHDLRSVCTWGCILLTAWSHTDRWAFRYRDGTRDYAGMTWRRERKDGLALPYSWSSLVESYQGLLWYPQVESYQGLLWYPQVESYQGLLWYPTIPYVHFLLLRSLLLSKKEPRKAKPSPTALPEAEKGPRSGKAVLDSKEMVRSPISPIHVPVLLDPDNETDTRT